MTGLLRKITGFLALAGGVFVTMIGNPESGFQLTLAASLIFIIDSAVDEITANNNKVTKD